VASVHASASLVLSEKRSASPEQQSSPDEQISSSYAGKQTSRARKVGGRHLAGWSAVDGEINSGAVAGAGARVPKLVRDNAWRAECFEAYWTQTDPDFFLGLSLSD
jgi:hypothetical protein